MKIDCRKIKLKKKKQDRLRFYLIIKRLHQLINYNKFRMQKF